jgi:hypothetical protein
MNKIQVTRPTFLINLDNPIEVSYEPMDGNWKSIIVQTYQRGFPEIKDDEILYVFKENITSDITKNDRGYILKTNNIMEKYEKEIKWFWIGFSIGAIVGITILDLVQRGLI